jgi:type II secretory pathway predicted ATPase ExeA
VPAGSYERYGLTGNPFRDLTSEGLENIELFHVNLVVDEGLRSIREEVLSKENKALVALVGSHGTGKTHRLRFALAEARAEGAFCVFYDVTDKVTNVMKGLAHEFLAAKPLGGFSKLFSAPPWYREMAALQKSSDKNYDPIKTGKAISRALNENAPSLLLLNDLHNLMRTEDAEAFSKTLQEVADQIKPGVLVMFGCYPSYLVNLTKNRPALVSRINRTFLLPTLSIDEAGLLIAKKLLAKRIVEKLDPLYPFDEEAVAALNTASYGNPRRLVELADRALEYAVEHRSYRVDADIVRASMPSPHAMDRSGSPPEGDRIAPSPSHRAAGSATPRPEFRPTVPGG